MVVSALAVIQQGRSLVPHEGSADELKEFILALEGGNADINVLKKLALLCSENPVAEDELPSPPLTPSQRYATLGSNNLVATLNRAPKADIWNGGKLFDQLLAALMQYLQLDKVGGQISEGRPLLTFAFYLAGRGRARVWVNFALGDAREPVPVFRRTGVRSSRPPLPSTIR